MTSVAWFLGSVLLIGIIARVAYKTGYRDGRLMEVKAAILHLDNDSRKRRAL